LNQLIKFIKNILLSITKGLINLEEVKTDYVSEFINNVDKLFSILIEG